MRDMCAVFFGVFVFLCPIVFLGFTVGRIIAHYEYKGNVLEANKFNSLCHPKAKVKGSDLDFLSLDFEGCKIINKRK